ncbi:hypothetical protein [Microbacterium invictum]|uniref:Ig-like domain-containing protein n=1 Tax=Microbacterium invictum TaxID=515415 RepID=A0ABZ0VE25_9MICO|nr:hypothetical protein [Microbacterium invictum]WQB71646.1 hypothetical protein T9R20_06740 [Microbacterium invictum]
MRHTRLPLAAAAAAVLILATAAPANADHNAGAGLTDATGGPSSCYAGASTPGTPGVDITTRNWRTAEYGGSLHLVCYFTVPSNLPAPSEGSPGEEKGPWVSPTRPTTSISTSDNCLPPGTEAAGETWLDTGEPAPKSRTKVVAYKNSIVMYCSWPLSVLH